MRRLPLRSRKGCRRCKERRRKCDEQKPVCGECLRLGMKCDWTAPRALTSTGKSFADVVVLPPRSFSTAETRLTELIPPLSETAGGNFMTLDHPSTLRASATSIVSSADEKQVLQYLFEQGHRILRYPLRRVPISINVNTWRRGYPMAISAPKPIQVQALLCLGAAFLSKIYPQYEEMSLRQYHSTMSAFRIVLQNQGDDFPAEWTCAVAAILSYFQMIVFHSAKSRLALLLGFLTLVEARIEKGLPWSRGRVLLEHYIHSLSTNILFHSKELLAHRSINNIDHLLEVLNSEERPLGSEIVGVPEEMTKAMYKLSFLNDQDTKKSPWTFELAAITAVVREWQPQIDMTVSSAKHLLLLARLYHLACLCLVDHIWARNSHSADSQISVFVLTACELVNNSSLDAEPMNSIVWPIIILGIFARDLSHRQVFRRQVQSLAKYAQLEGYRSVLNFLDRVWDDGVGPAVLQQPEMLAIVYI